MRLDSNGQNLDVALQLAQTAKAKLPDSAQVSDTLGWILYKKGLINVAIPHLRRGVEQNPSNPNIHYHLGLAYSENGETANARRSFEQALKLNPQFREAEDAKRALATLN
jgi:Flp pilus assembly protein TadD